MGTSLPEFVTSVVAARKNEVDMAFGNVIGSNIFNILFILGVTAAISPVGKHSCMGVCMEQASYREKRRCGAACIICSISGVYLYEIGGLQKQSFDKYVY